MGGAGFAVIKYDRVVLEAVHSRGELASKCKTMQKCERVRSAQFPRGKSNTRSDATPSIDCSKHRLLVKWTETLFKKALYKNMSCCVIMLLGGLWP